MKFKSRKDILFRLIIFGCCAFFIGIILFGIFQCGISHYDFDWSDMSLVLVVAFFMWLYFGTEYPVTETELKYKSGPIRGKIEIEQIREIIEGKSLWAGLKPATARNGLII